MASVYPPAIYNECKLQFIENNQSPRVIAESLYGKPSKGCIEKWARKPDNTGKTWYDYRDDKRDAQYMQLSPSAMASKILEKIQQLLQKENFDAATADQLWKLQKSLERVTDVRLQIPVMYQLLEDLINFMLKHHKRMVTKPFLNAIREFKDSVRQRLDH